MLNLSERVLKRLRPHQREAVLAAEGVSKGKIILPTGGGKCLAKGTEISMYNGQVKKVEDIVVGDTIMGDDSTPRTVLSLASGSETMYDVIPSKGSKYRVNESHILSLKVTGIKDERVTVLDNKYKTGDIVDISVLDYLALSKHAKHVLKGYRTGVNFQNNNSNLPMSPRLLGLWLADGTATLPSFTVNNEDVETIAFLQEQADLLGLKLTVSKNSDNSKVYYIATKLKGNGAIHTNVFLNFLRDTNIFDNKHVPQIYKTAPRKDRLELLAGILDGDGSLSGNCFDLTLKNERLMDDIIFIIRSLGFACYKKPKKAGIKSINFEGNYFRIHISGNVVEIPTAVSRKRATKRKQKKNVLVTGIKVKNVGIGDYYGFEIDGNRRFLLSDFTVTHNTYCQAAQVALDIAINPGTFGVYVTNAPRIVLTYQLLKEYYGFLTLAGIEARYLFVHSGGTADEAELEDIRLQSNLEMGTTIPYAEIKRAIYSEAISEVAFTARKQKLPLIIMSTYHSYLRIEEAAAKSFPGEIRMVLNDEAHHLVQEQFHATLDGMTAPKQYFYTATEKTTAASDGRGMNNCALFGATLVSMTPREAINIGLMVPPRLHIVRPSEEAEYLSEDYDRSISKIVYEAFSQHREFVGSVPAKLLVASGGTQGIKAFLESTEQQTLRDEGVNVCVIASHEDVGNIVNGEQVTRQGFLKSLKDMGTSNTELIVLHYDILTEGIDIPGFSGLLLMRDMNLTKFRQSYGRVGRRDQLDSARIFAGEIAPDDYGKMLKPFAYVILPLITQYHTDDTANIKKLINELRYYLVNPSELVASHTEIKGMVEEEPLDGLNALDDGGNVLGRIIDELDAELEREEDARLNHMDWGFKVLGKLDE